MPITLIKAKEVVSGGVLKPAPITNQFDPALVAPHIQVAEYSYLVPLICKEMYQDMISKQNTDASNYNPDLGPLVEKFPSDANYETLWAEHLEQLISYAVILTALPLVGMQIATSGVFFNQIEWGENAGVKGVTFLEDRIKQNLNTRQGMLQNYLCENADNYPLFPADKFCNSCNCEGGCDCEGLQSIQKNNFNGGFMLSNDYQKQPYKKRNDFY
jgi:hypothetical protein